MLGKTTANIKFAINHIGLSIKKQHMKPTRNKYTANENFYNRSSDQIKMLKVQLDQFPSDKVIEVLSNTEIVKFLSDNNNFINDIEFTQDFSGLINKEVVITSLLSNRDSRMQGFYDLATHTTLDNDFKNSRSCLNFIQHTNNGDIRYEFYRKFVQNLENRSFKDLVGSDIGGYISKPKDKLEKAFMPATDTRTLRLEITFFRHST